MSKALGSNRNSRKGKLKNMKKQTVETFANYVSHKEFVSPYKLIINMINNLMEWQVLQIVIF